MQQAGGVPSNDGRRGEISSGLDDGEADVAGNLPLDREGVRGSDPLRGLEKEEAAEAELQLELAACQAGCFRVGIGMDADAMVLVGSGGLKSDAMSKGSGGSGSEEGVEEESSDVVMFAWVGCRAVE